MGETENREIVIKYCKEFEWQDARFISGMKSISGENYVGYEPVVVMEKLYFDVMATMVERYLEHIAPHVEGEKVARLRADEAESREPGKLREDGEVG